MAEFDCVQTLAASLTCACPDGVHVRLGRLGDSERAEAEPIGELEGGRPTRRAHRDEAHVRPRSR